MMSSPDGHHDLSEFNDPESGAEDPKDDSNDSVVPASPPPAKAIEVVELSDDETMDIKTSSHNYPTPPRDQSDSSSPLHELQAAELNTVLLPIPEGMIPRSQDLQSSPSKTLFVSFTAESSSDHPSPAKMRVTPSPLPEQDFDEAVGEFMAKQKQKKHKSAKRKRPKSKQCRVTVEMCPDPEDATIETNEDYSLEYVDIQDPQPGPSKRKPRSGSDSSVSISSSRSTVKLPPCPSLKGLMEKPPSKKKGRRKQKEEDDCQLSQMIIPWRHVPVGKA